MSKAAVYLLLVIAAILRLYTLGDKSLWLDEAWALDFASVPYWEIITNRIERNPPLYYLILRIWTDIFGISEFSMRMPSVIFSMLSLWLVSLFAGKDKKTQLTAVVLATFSFELIDFAQMARAYSLFIMSTLLSFYTLVKWLDKPERSTAIGYILATALMAYSHHYWMFNFFAQIIFILGYHRKNKKILIAALNNSIAIVLLYLPYLSIFLEQMLKVNMYGFWIEEPSITTALRILDKFLLWQGQTWAYVGIALLLFIALLQNKRSISTPSIRTTLLITWAVIPLTVAYIYSMFNTSIFLERYLVSVVPALIILVAIFIAKFCSKQICIALCLIYCASTFLTAPKFYKWQREDWKSITNLLKKERKTEEHIVPIPFVYTYPFHYYSDLELQTFTNLATGKVTPSPRVWLITATRGLAYKDRFLGYKLEKTYQFDENIKVELLGRQQ